MSYQNLTNEQPCPSEDGDCTDFRTELESLLNRFSRENTSNTPDFMLRDFLCSCLRAFDVAIIARDKWYGIKPVPGTDWKKNITRTAQSGTGWGGG